MREEIRNVGRLEHILNSIDVLLRYKEQYTLEEILNNPITFHGFVKYIEIIGEASYMLTKDFKAKHNEINWIEIEGMRHVLVHGYYKIVKEDIIQTLNDDIAPLRPFIQKYYDEEMAKQDNQ